MFDRTAPEVARVARHLARSRDEAEDLVQGTYLAAIESAAIADVDVELGRDDRIRANVVDDAGRAVAGATVLI